MNGQDSDPAADVEDLLNPLPEAGSVSHRDGKVAAVDAAAADAAAVEAASNGSAADGGTAADGGKSPAPPKRRRFRRGRYDRSVRPVRRHHPDRHPLHPIELLLMAWRTLRLEPARIIVPAIIIFGLDAFQSTWFTEISTDHLGWESVSGLVFFGVSTLGLTFYSGMLERLVGALERNQMPQPVSKVLATLPWLRLLGAEVLLVVVSAVAALFFIIPGLVVGTLTALVGPVINLTDSNIREAFRRSVRLVWPHFWLVFVMVTVPLAMEHELVVLIADLVPHEALVAVFLTNFVLGVVFGLALGLIEVSLAERLISGAQGPGREVRPDNIELRQGMERPIVHRLPPSASQMD